jgi:WD40 repeat protein
LPRVDQPHPETDAPRPTVGNVERRRYRAFLSYSHAADRNFAPLLHRALEQLGKPWYKRRSLSIFRDDTDLAVSPQLWPKIESSMTDCEYVLLLACPEAAASAGVNRELRHWVEVLKRDPKNVLIAVTGGRLVWDEESRDFDWSQTTAVPPALQRNFRGGPEPLWADFSRRELDGPQRMEDAAFRAAALKIAAALHGMAPRDLDSEDLRQHRTTIRTFGAFVAGLVILLVAAVLLFVDARNQRNEADRRARIAQSRALAIQAMDRSDKSFDVSLLLSVESHLAANTLESRKALLQNLLASPHLDRFVHGSRDVVSLAFHPRQPLLVALSKHSVSVSNVRSNQAPAELAHQDAEYKALRLFDAGKKLAATTSDGTLVLWDLDARKHIADIAPAPPDDAGDYGVETNGPLLPTETSSSIVVWDLNSRSVRATIPLQQDDPVLSVASSPAGDVIAVATRSVGVRLWDLRKHSYRLTQFTGHRGFVDALAFSPDGKLLASGAADESVMLWDVETGSRRRWWPKQPAWVFLLQFSPDSRFLAWGMRSGQVRIFDQKEDQFLDTGALGFRTLSALEFSADSRALAVAGSDQTTVLDLLERSRIMTVEAAHRDRIIGVIFSPAANLAVSASRDGELILWNIAGMVVAGRAKAPAPLAGCLSFSPQGESLITCSDAGPAFLWQITSSSAKLLGTIAAQSGKVTTAAFRPDGTVVAVGDESGRVSLWERANLLGSTSKTLASVGCRITDVGFSSQNDAIAVGCDEGKIQVIDSAGRQLAEFKASSNPITGVAFSPDGKQLFSGGLEGIATWNLESRTRAAGTVLEFNQSGADAIALSRTGEMIASASRAGWLGLWDTETKALLGGLRSHGDAFYSIAFAPGGTRLAAGSGYSVGTNNALMFLDLDPEHWVRQACAIAARNLTPDEWRRYIGEGSPRDTCAADHAHD